MIKDLYTSRPVVLGRVKIGQKGEKHPEKFDHFRVYKAEKDEKGQPVLDAGLQQMLEMKYGTPLTVLPIYFLCNTTEANFDSSYAYFKSVGDRTVCVCQGDGENAMRCDAEKTAEGWKLVKDAKGDYVRKKIACPCDKFNPSLDVDQKLYPCKWAGKLAFMLADYPKGGGYFLFRTHSLNSIRNLFFTMKQLEAMTFGNMAGIPVNLVLDRQRNSKNMEIYVVRLEWNFDPKQIRLRAIEEVRSIAHLKNEIAATEQNARKLLEAADKDEDIVDEFYPETREEPKKKADKKTEAVPDAVGGIQAKSDDEKLASMLTPESPKSIMDKINSDRAAEKATSTPAPAPTPKKRGRPKATAEASAPVATPTEPLAESPQETKADEPMHEPVTPPSPPEQAPEKPKDEDDHLQFF